MDVYQIILFSFVGFSTGFFSGMFGIGGGSIRIPLLSLAGMPLINAFATNMFAIPFSSSIGAYTQKKNIDFKVSKKFIPGAVLGIILATFLISLISEKTLAIIFLFAAVITVASLYLDKINKKAYEKLKPTSFKLFAGGFLANIIIGSRGGSGGTLFPPFLKAMHVEMHKAIATSLFAGVFSSIAALFIYLMRGEVIFLPAIIVALTGIAGSYFGSKVSMKTDSKWLKAGLSLIIMILALVVVFNEFV